MNESALQTTGLVRIAHLFTRDKPYQSAEAFAALYDRTHLLIYRYAYGLTGGPPQEVEDITAETFLKAWKARSTFEGTEEAVIGWLVQIARRLVIDRYRRQQTRPPETGVDDLIMIAPDASPEEETAIREQCGILWQLLQALPEDQREMLVLRYMLGWRVKQIAAHFNLPANTVSVKIIRVIDQLRANWPYRNEE